MTKNERKGEYLQPLTLIFNSGFRSFNNKHRPDEEAAGGAAAGAPKVKEGAAGAGAEAALAEAPKIKGWAGAGAGFSGALDGAADWLS